VRSTLLWSLTLINKIDILWVTQARVGFASRLSLRTAESRIGILVGEAIAFHCSPVAAAAGCGRFQIVSPSKGRKRTETVELLDRAGTPALSVALVPKKQERQITAAPQSASGSAAFSCRVVENGAAWEAATWTWVKG
jgi:hypothetical protein